MTPSQIALRARKNNPVYHALLAEIEEWASEGHPELHVKKVANKNGYWEWPYNPDLLDSALILLRADGFKVIGDVDDNRNNVIKIYAL